MAAILSISNPFLSPSKIQSQPSAPFTTKAKVNLNPSSKASQHSLTPSSPLPKQNLPSFSFFPTDFPAATKTPRPTPNLPSFSFFPTDFLVTTKTQQKPPSAAAESLKVSPGDLAQDQTSSEPSITQEKASPGMSSSSTSDPHRPENM